MNRKQQLSIVAFFVILSCVYLFGSTKDPAVADRKVNPEVETANQGFDFDSYLTAVREGLTAEQKLEANQLDGLITSAPSDLSKTALLDSAIAFYSANNQFLAVANFQTQKAELLNTAEEWKSSGDAYAVFVGNQGMPPEMKSYISENGIAAYQRALNLEPDNKDVKINLASIYLENDAQVMNGVQLLLGIVAEEPKNAPANLLLGKYGVISGQFEKAISRLENVVSSQPENAEALFLLAEAYNGSGNKDKAIENFQRCKQLINNEDFRKEIDKYIESINIR